MPRTKTPTMLTPAAVAALFHVSRATVKSWVDAGLLIGIKLPGGSGMRFTASSLADFERRHSAGLVERKAAPRRRAVSKFDGPFLPD